MIVEGLDTRGSFESAMRMSQYGTVSYQKDVRRIEMMLKCEAVLIESKGGLKVLQ